MSVIQNKVLQGAVIPGGESETNRLLDEHYPDLAQLHDSVWTSVLEAAKFQMADAGRELISGCEVAEEMFLLLEGSVRVSQHSDDGREITFYRVDAGHICSLNIYSLVHQKSLGVMITAETPLKMLSIKQQDFFQAFHGSEGFRSIILNNLTESIFTLANTLIDSTFNTLETRLVEVLHKLAYRQGSPIIKITHQGLANELGSTREVISRLLKTFEQRGKIKLSRGCIELKCERIRKELAEKIAS